MNDNFSANPKAFTTDIQETIQMLRDPKFAIEFALEYLEYWEIAIFLKDWQNGGDLEVFLEGLAEDRAGAALNREIDEELGIHTSE